MISSIQHIYFCIVRDKKTPYILILLLTIPALFVNLGMAPPINDEAIRALVTLEMKLRGNLIVPTIGGEYYFNKPPLYNWIIFAFFNLTSSFSYFVLRIPTIVFLYLFALTIFLVTRKFYGNRFGFIVALVFLTSGRMLFYDSFRGLIDTCFSWLIFLSFITVFLFSKKEKYLILFLLSYFISALAFLLKGLPALAFQGITLLAWFSIQKKFKQLIGWRHFVGILLFLLIVASYYYIYYLYNPSEIGTVFATLYSESAKKSAIGFNPTRVILHLFNFPFEFFYHFLPWSVLCIYLFKKGALKNLLNDSFLKFCMVTFLANIMVYWFSPDTFARYLFMFIPLLFIVLLRLHFKNQTENTRYFRIIFHIIWGATILSILVFLSFPFLALTRNVEYPVLKSLVVATPVGLVAYNFKRKKRFMLEFFIVVLLLARIGFNWFIQPSRYADTQYEIYLHDVDEVNRIVDNQPLYYADKEIKEVLKYELTLRRRKLLIYKPEFSSPGFYIVFKEQKLPAGTETKVNIHMYGNRHVYNLVKIW